MNSKRGCEEIDTFPEGTFLRQCGSRFIMLFGKYSGAYADTIPRGYIRNYILKKYEDDLTDTEQAVFKKLAPPKNTNTETAETV